MKSREKYGIELFRPMPSSLPQRLEIEKAFQLGVEEKVAVSGAAGGGVHVTSISLIHVYGRRSGSEGGRRSESDQWRAISWAKANLEN